MIIRKKNLRDDPKCPFGDLRWNGYYWEYNRETPYYEGDYWGMVKDPDGNSRDMLSDEERRKQTEDMKPILDKINSLPGGKLLDIGCGPGFLLSAVNSHWDKYGVDISAVALDYAKKFATVQKGEFPCLNYVADGFEVVVMNHVIEHLSDPIRYVQECYRVLKPEGIIIIATPDFDSGCARWFGKNYRMLCDKGHVSLFTSFSLVKMLETLDFEILEIEFPFFESRWFTKENLLRMFDRSKVSPPFYGNHVIVVAKKMIRDELPRVMDAPFIEGESISLVKLTDRFIDDMLEYSKKMEFYSYMELLPVKTMEDMRVYLEKILNRVRKGNAVYWAIVLNSKNKMIGTFGVVDIDSNSGNAQIGYGLSPDYWHKGYFTQALSMVLRQCFETIGLNRVSALTMTGNMGSIKGLEHAGFSREGVLRQHYKKIDGTRYDAELFSILRDDYTRRQIK